MQRRIFSRDDFSDELVSGYAGKAIISSQQLQVGIADSAVEQADRGMAVCPARGRHTADRGCSILKVNRDHAE
jgi:hypothetical protein